ncbi:MAG: UvrD-helicase domain-containing protein, partial [Clostridia bacterium]|nr:UvrD-helicase domain-containing protein [Clostridia bacterium]
MEREWTKKQREAIEKRGDLIVSAAAGAGKTAVL